MTHITRFSIRTLIATATIAATLAWTGCASIVHGGDRKVTVNSTPSEAKVVVLKADTKAAVTQGTTPITFELSPKKDYFKGQSYTLVVSKDGYKPVEIAIKPKLSGWYIGNVVFGGLIGILIVDPLTGSMWNLTPEQATATLTPGQASMLQKDGSLMVALLEETSEQQRALMSRVN